MAIANENTLSITKIAEDIISSSLIKRFLTKTKVQTKCHDFSLSRLVFIDVSIDKIGASGDELTTV